LDSQQIKIVNIVAKTSFGHPIDLSKINEFRNEPLFRGMNFSYQRSILKIGWEKRKVNFVLWKSGKLICFHRKNKKAAKIAIEKFAKKLRKLGFIVKTEGFKIEIINIICLADMKMKIGCGIIQRVFPEAEKSKFGKEEFILPSKQGIVKIFLNGKLIGMGFKQETEAKETLQRIIKRIREAVEKYDKERVQICKVERLKPTLQTLKEGGGKLNLEQKVFEKAELLICQFLTKRLKNTLGHNPRVIAAGAVYNALYLLQNQGVDVEKRTQQEIAEAFNISIGSVKNGYRSIKAALEIEI
jgi:TATA-box binding protein (TBP) (component of TFIID and TFIIIB)